MVELIIGAVHFSGSAFAVVTAPPLANIAFSNFRRAFAVFESIAPLSLKSVVEFVKVS